MNSFLLVFLRASNSCWTMLVVYSRLFHQYSKLCQKYSEFSSGTFLSPKSPLEHTCSQIVWTSRSNKTAKCCEQSRILPSLWSDVALLPTHFGWTEFLVFTCDAFCLGKTDAYLYSPNATVLTRENPVVPKPDEHESGGSYESLPIDNTFGSKTEIGTCFWFLKSSVMQIPCGVCLHRGGVPSLFEIFPKLVMLLDESVDGPTIVGFKRPVWSCKSIINFCGVRASKCHWPCPR